MNCRTAKRFLLVFTLFVLAAALVVLPQAAFAQSGVDNPKGAFQLEGNATNESSICFAITSAGALTATPPCSSPFVLVTYGGSTDDWQNALAYGTHASDGLPLAAGFDTDVTAASGKGTDDIWQGGGSKDINGISTGPWEWTTGLPQGKDDIEHAFAAAFLMPNGHTGLFFGMDRFDNSGDSTAGFWFLQDSNIAETTTKSGGGFLFSGHHSNKDLLIISDFSTGGAISSIAVYEWSCTGTGAACDSSGSLVAATFPAGTVPYTECNPASTSGFTALCAIVNGTAGLTSPWGFLNKSGQTTYDHGEFLEGGVDLTDIFGSNGAIPCFTTFMSETRSSTSTSATLSDLTKPRSFPLCSLGISKACNGNGTPNTAGTEITYSFSATATNTGSGALYDIEIDDTLPDGTTETFTPTLPDSCNGTPCLLPKNSVTVNPITFTATNANCHAGVTNCTTPLSATNTATAKSCSGPSTGFPCSSGSEVDSTPPAGTATCSTTVASTLTIKKACDAANGGATLVPLNGVVEVEVFYTAKVCNTGASQLTNITLVDTSDSGNDTPSPSGFTLDAGACTPITGTGVVHGSYFPDAIDSTTGRFGFTDTIRITSATATLGSNPTPPSTNPCALVPGGSANDLACDTITCPICFDSVCTNNPQPSNF